LTHSAIAFFCAEEPDAFSAPDTPPAGADEVPVALLSLPHAVSDRVVAIATVAIAIRVIFTAVLLWMVLRYELKVNNGGKRRFIGKLTTGELIFWPCSKLLTFTKNPLFSAFPT
jgi:hypothetical protein